MYLLTENSHRIAIAIFTYLFLLYLLLVKSNAHLVRNKLLILTGKIGSQSTTTSLKVKRALRWIDTEDQIQFMIRVITQIYRVIVNKPDSQIITTVVFLAFSRCIIALALCQIIHEKATLLTRVLLTTTWKLARISSIVICLLHLIYSTFTLFVWPTYRKPIYSSNDLN